MRGSSNPSRRMASCPSSIVRTMQSWLSSQAWRRAIWVLTWTTASRSQASSIRDSPAPHRPAMYSVCPENGRPESATASLLMGAVTMASASPLRHISVAARTYSSAARPQLACKRPKVKPSRSPSAGTAWSAAFPSVNPVERPAISRMRASPATIQRASGAISGSASAPSTISGPTPAGSPMVRTMVGKPSIRGMSSRPGFESARRVSRTRRIW